MIFGAGSSILLRRTAEIQWQIKSAAELLPFLLEKNCLSIINY